MVNFGKFSPRKILTKKAEKRGYYTFRIWNMMKDMITISDRYGESPSEEDRDKMDNLYLKIEDFKGEFLKICQRSELVAHRHMFETLNDLSSELEILIIHYFVQAISYHISYVMMKYRDPALIPSIPKPVAYLDRSEELDRILIRHLGGTICPSSKLYNHKYLVTKIACLDCMFKRFWMDEDCTEQCSHEGDPTRIVKFINFISSNFDSDQNWKNYRF